MPERPEERYKVDLTITLSWQDKAGLVPRGTGRCVDLSASGARLEPREPLDVRAHVLVNSGQFSVAFSLGDPMRQKILSGVLRPDAPV